MSEAPQPPLSVYRRYAPLLPMVVLVACCISTIVAVFAYNFVLEPKQYGALAVTATTVISFFWLRSYYKYCLVLIVVLGLSGLLQFTVAQASMGFTFGDIRIGLSPLMVLFGVLVYATNSKKINAKLLALAKPSDEKIAQQRQEETAEFKQKFSRKSTEELVQILAANNLVATALSAARQLLRERSEAGITAQ